jgi:hypothetical protein
MAVIAHMVAETCYEADGLTVTYGAGELYQPDALPDGIPWREVLASPAFVASSPDHDRPGGLKAKAGRGKPGR